MNKVLKLSILALIALTFSACGGAVDNKPATNGSNTSNSNSAKPAAAAPTKESLLEMDKKANEAYLKGDSKFFEGFLGDKFVMYSMGKREDKASAVKMITGVKCDVKTWSLDDPQMSMVDADTAVIVYKSKFDGTCNGPDGKAMKIPSPIRAASLYTRSGDKWSPVYHGETAIIDPKNPPKAPPAPPAKAADKKDSKAADDAKSSAPAADPNTDALMAVEKSGWEAWKARDPKKLEELTTKDLSFIDLFGTYSATKADTIKAWTEGKCEIKSVNLTDGVGTSLSPTLGILTFKGSADGTCEGQKIMPVYGTSVYVKDGDTWKLAFGFEAPA